MPLHTIIHSFEAGLGGTLGHIAVVVALGTMLGKMMAESGGADQIAYTLIRFFGEKNIHWAMVVIGLIVGLPAFFEVGFVLLIPIAFTVARRTQTSLVLVGLPMVAGLSVVHGLVPPHPAAMLAVTIFHADVGRTIFYALLIGIPTASYRRTHLRQAHRAAHPTSRREPDGRPVRRSRFGAQPAQLLAHFAHHPAAGPYSCS